MKTYCVAIDRIEYRRGTIEVEAENKKEAEEVALSKYASDELEIHNAEESVTAVYEKGFRIDNLDPFTRAYIECALWSSYTGGDDSDTGVCGHLDEKYDIQDLSEEAHQLMCADCFHFQRENDELISANPSQAGHDFWLTRNHHGSGFWDDGWSKEVGKKLTEACESYKECDLYVGDNGQIYVG